MNTAPAQSIFVRQVVEAIQSVTGSGHAALHEPVFAGNEWAYVKECLDTGWVSSVGKFVDRFEAELAAFTGVRHAVAAVNGTAALHMCLKLVGVQADDEVLIPSLTFVATANAVAYCGAVPHFVDSEWNTLGVDPAKLERHLASIAEIREGGCYNRVTGRRMKALVPMHTFGHPAEMDSIAAVAEKFGIALVEDAAESMGSYYKGKHTGSWGKVSALSFNGNKVITTGGGGAILTNDGDMAKLAKHLTTTAKVSHQWAFFHDMVGYNYRMPNINAALGCAQLEELPGFLAVKRDIAQRYARALQGVEGIRFFVEPTNASSNYWLNVLVLDDAVAHERNALLEALAAAGIMARPPWTLMHKLPMFENCLKMDLSVAIAAEARIINIPSSVSLQAARS